MARFTILLILSLITAPAMGASEQTTLSDFSEGSKITIYRKGIKPEIYRTTSVYTFKTAIDGVKTQCQLFLPFAYRSRSKFSKLCWQTVATA